MSSRTRLAGGLLFFVLVLMALALFISALWFFDSYLSDGRTTAYAPIILWGVTFTDRGSILNIVYGTLISSFIIGNAASFGFAWLLRGSK